MSTAGRPSRRLALALVAAGGALGSLLRFALEGWVPGWPPLATLVANVAAAALLGALLHGAPADRFGPQTRLLVGTGFCGSLSTYSTFAAETAALDPIAAAAYVGATYGLGGLAVVGGGAISRWLV